MIYKRCEHTGQKRDRCTDPWYATFQHGKLRARVSLAKWTGRDVRTKTDALQAYDDLKQELRAGRFNPAGLAISNPAKAPKTLPEVLTFRAVCALYERDYVKARRLRTADDLPYRLKPLLADFGDLPIAELTRERIVAFQAARRDRMEDQDRSIAWLNRPLSLLRGILNWAVEQKYLDTAPTFELDDEDYSRWRRVAPEEEARLLANADPMLRALIIVALDTGMRRGEMLALRIKDVDLSSGVIRLRGTTTKDAETRDLPIATERLKSCIAWLRQGADGTDRPSLSPLFARATGDSALSSFRYHWDRCRLKSYGFEPSYTATAGLIELCRRQLQEIDLHWHDLRHEFACRLDDRGVSLGVIQRALGHASIDTTQRYLRRGVRELAAAVVRLDDGSLPAVVLPAKGTSEDSPIRPNVSQEIDEGMGAKGLEPLTSCV